MERTKIAVNSIQASRPGYVPFEIDQVTPARGGRHYLVTNEDGSESKLPSVTSILSAVWPKPFLVNWQAKLRQEAMESYLRDNLGEIITEETICDLERELASPDQVRDEAARLGTWAHDVFGRKLNGEDISGYKDPASSKEDVESILDGIESTCKYLADGGWRVTDVETAMYCHNYRTGAGYAGTIDALMRREDGRRLLVEVKTSKDLYVEAYLQAAAYTWGLGDIDVMLVRLPKENSQLKIRKLAHTSIEHYEDHWSHTFDFYTSVKGAKNSG